MDKEYLLSTLLIHNVRAFVYDEAKEWTWNPSPSVWVSWWLRPLDAGWWRDAPDLLCCDPGVRCYWLHPQAHYEAVLTSHWSVTTHPRLSLVRRHKSWPLIGQLLDLIIFTFPLSKNFFFVQKRNNHHFISHPHSQAKRRKGQTGPMHYINSLTCHCMKRILFL